MINEELWDNLIPINKTYQYIISTMKYYTNNEWL